MSILDKIIEHKRVETDRRKRDTPIAQLTKMPMFFREVISLGRSLQEKRKTGIIAEFKRMSPSKGVLNNKASVLEISSAYNLHGASALSILTDEHYFGGKTRDLNEARVNQIPILRKDFILEEYQVLETKAMGADVILLIASCLTPEEIKNLTNTAKNIGLEVLLEIHDESELEHLCNGVDMVGVNSRNLKTLQINISAMPALASMLPEEMVKIAESGITDVETIVILKEAGFSGFLIGEHFMKQPDPAIAFARFVEQLNAKAR